MLTHIGLKSFKAFREMDSLELRPITVLAGANSSGKSSVIHALLLLKQTLESRRNHPLILNGEFLGFSSYNEIVFGKHESESVTFNLGLATSLLPDSLNERRLSKFFSEAEVKAILGEIQPNRLQGTYQFTFGLHREEPGEGIVLQAMEMSSVLGGREQRRAELRLGHTRKAHTGTVIIPSPKGLESPSEVIDVEWMHFLPARCVYRSESVYRQDASDRPERGDVPLDLFGIDNLRSELSERLHYVGPLRSEPRRAYFILGDRVELDYRGEYTTQVLLTEKEPVDYLIDDQKKPVGLLEAVNRTLKMMGVPQCVSPVSREGVVSQLMLPLIGDDSREVTIVDVGFGVSQLLPIIVAGLWAKSGDLVIFEQPETHLHPKIQESLARFLVLLHRLGKRVIVETHSDHLINGLRVLIAADQTDALQAAVQVAFVRMPEAKGEGSSIELLQFDEYGMIVNWPPEFISDSMKQMQEILRLGVEKQRRKRGSEASMCL